MAAILTRYTSPVSARHLIIGLDGADLDRITEFGSDALPHLHKLIAQGAHARLESVQPPATLPNWTTFLTGVDPGRHGVFDFTVRRGYSIQFRGGTVRETPTFISRLDRLGLQCACIGFPATWPPEPLQNGAFISGWDAPVAFEGDASFVWPQTLHQELLARFGPQRFDDVNEFDADAPGWHAQLPTALADRIQRKTELATWLLDSRDWDVFAFYFGESDTAAHHLWAHHDPRSPRHPERNHVANGLRTVYRALDQAVGHLHRSAGSPVEVTIVSDHGSGGSGTKVLYLNRALEEAGLLKFRAQGSAPLTNLAKRVALTRLPPALRQRMFSWGNAALPSWLESRARFGAIDMSATTAFSDELNYFPAVWLNIKGREPSGTIAQPNIAQARRRVVAALRALRDPWTHQPVVRDVWSREELFEGPHVERAPDLLLRFHLDEGYSYNLMPSADGPPGCGPWRILQSSEHLGRKGRSLPGSHRDHGIAIFAGPRILPIGQIEARIADASATCLARMGIAVPSDFAGRVCFEALRESGELRTLPHVAMPAAPRRGDESRVHQRLVALGYIDN